MLFNLLKLNVNFALENISAVNRNFLESYIGQSVEQIELEQAEKLQSLVSNPDRLKQLQEIENDTSIDNPQLPDETGQQITEEMVEIQPEVSIELDPLPMEEVSISQPNDLPPEVIGIIVAGALIGALIIGVGGFTLYKYNKDKQKEEQWDEVPIQPHQARQFANAIIQKSPDQFNRVGAHCIDQQQYPLEQQQVGLQRRYSWSEGMQNPTDQSHNDRYQNEKNSNFRGRRY